MTPYLTIFLSSLTHTLSLFLLFLCFFIVYQWLILSCSCCVLLSTAARDNGYNEWRDICKWVWIHDFTCRCRGWRAIALRLNWRRNRPLFNLHCSLSRWPFSCAYNLSLTSAHDWLPKQEMRKGWCPKRWFNRCSNLLASWLYFDNSFMNMLFTVLYKSSFWSFCKCKEWIELFCTTRVWLSIVRLLYYHVFSIHEEDKRDNCSSSWQWKLPGSEHSQSYTSFCGRRKGREWMRLGLITQTFSFLLFRVPTHRCCLPLSADTHTHTYVCVLDWHLSHQWKIKSHWKWHCWREKSVH